MTNRTSPKSRSKNTYSIDLPPDGEAPLPCAKIGGSDPAKVTFILQQPDGSIAEKWEFVLTFDDPIPDDPSAPVVFNNSGQTQKISVSVSSNATGKEYSYVSRKITKRVTMLDFSSGKVDEVGVFVSLYRRK